jgi:DNA repair exonuclease SbcCD ATPase subunit
MIIIVIKIVIVKIGKIHYNDKVQGREVQEMARGAVIEADELYETANRLEAEGKEVTAISLHKALGRGSLTTIYKFFETWKSTRPAKVLSASTEVPEIVKNAFAGVWRVAAQEAAREVEAVKAKALEEVKDALNQFHGALEAIEKLEQENEAGAVENEALKKQAADDQEKITRLEADNAAHKATSVQLQKLVEKLEQDLDRQRKEAKEEQDKHHDEKLELTSKIEMWTENLRMHKEAATKQESDYKALKEKHENILRGQREAEAASKASQAERDAAMKEAAELKGVTATLKEQNEQLMARLDKSKKHE